MKRNTDKLNLILSMVLFGTIGAFVKYIPLPSSAIALTRAAIGALFILAFMLITGKKINFKAIKDNLLLLLISGGLMGFNWILLFEAYKYTTVAAATLCYYLAPIFVIIASPFVLKEKLTAKKVICVGLALLGMVAVSGIFTQGLGSSAVIGAAMGVGAALLYAVIVLLNKKMQNISGYDRTAVQLSTSAIVLIPYVLLTEKISSFRADVPQAMLLITVAILHTGIAYALYFGSVANIKAQAVAILSYIDPLVALLISFTVLKEKPDLPGIVGALLILGATLFSELNIIFKRKQTKH